MVFELGAAHRSAKNSYLVAKNGVLELELGHTPTCSEWADDANEQEVGEGSQGARDATDRCQSSGETEFWSPTR